MTRIDQTFLSIPLEKRVLAKRVWERYHIASREALEAEITFHEQMFSKQADTNESGSKWEKPQNGLYGIAPEWQLQLDQIMHVWGDSNLRKAKNAYINSSDRFLLIRGVAVSIL